MKIRPYISCLLTFSLLLLVSNYRFLGEPAWLSQKSSTGQTIAFDSQALSPSSLIPATRPYYPHLRASLIISLVLGLSYSVIARAEDNGVAARNSPSPLHNLAETNWMIKDKDMNGFSFISVANQLSNTPHFPTSKDEMKISQTIQNVFDRDPRHQLPIVVVFGDFKKFEPLLLGRTVRIVVYNPAGVAFDGLAYIMNTFFWGKYLASVGIPSESFLKFNANHELRHGLTIPVMADYIERVSRDILEQLSSKGSPIHDVQRLNTLLEEAIYDDEELEADSSGLEKVIDIQKAKEYSLIVGHTQQFKQRRDEAIENILRLLPKSKLRVNDLKKFLENSLIAPKLNDDGTVQSYSNTNIKYATPQRLTPRERSLADKTRVLRDAA